MDARQFHMNQQSDKQSHPIDDALNIAPLIRPTLDKLDVSTVGDLLALKIDSARAIKGVGGAKIDAIVAAIEQAQIYCGGVFGESAADVMPEQTESRELVFVPSLLRKMFNRHEITETSHLFQLLPRDLENQSGWGDRKIQLVAALQRLYRSLGAATPTTRVADIAAEICCPTTASQPSHSRSSWMNRKVREV